MTWDMGGMAFNMTELVIGTPIPALVINRWCLLLQFMMPGKKKDAFTSRPVAATDNSAREGEEVIILQWPRKRGRRAASSAPPFNAR